MVALKRSTPAVLILSYISVVVSILGEQSTTATFNALLVRLSDALGKLTIESCRLECPA
jgi:hypothetical protein